MIVDRLKARGSRLLELQLQFCGGKHDVQVRGAQVALLVRFITVVQGDAEITKVRNSAGERGWIEHLVSLGVDQPGRRLASGR